MSRAMTCRSVSTKSPFAPVCRIVIMVEAGAVAAAREARTIENAKLSLSTRKLRTKISADAKNASARVMTKTFIPFFFNAESLKYSPVEKAMNARAISERKSMPSITFEGIRSKQNGPISIPVMIYAVTLGSLSFLVMRVSKNPTSSIMDTEIIITAPGEVSDILA